MHRARVCVLIAACRRKEFSAHKLHSVNHGGWISCFHANHYKSSDSRKYDNLMNLSLGYTNIQRRKQVFHRITTL